MSAVPSRAVIRAGHRPPMRATMTTTVMKLRKFMLSEAAPGPREMNRAVSASGASAPITQPRIRRTFESGLSRRTSRPGRHDRAAWAWVTMWTSMSAAELITRLATPGPAIRPYHGVRETPRTICEALTVRANSMRAFATSSPTTVCHVAPFSSASSRARSRSGAAPDRVPSGSMTWTTRSSRPATRPAMRSPRRMSVIDSGPPVTATMMRSRAAHVSRMPLASRYSSRPSSTRSASQRRASSRSAVRLPSRK